MTNQMDLQVEADRRALEVARKIAELRDQEQSEKNRLEKEEAERRLRESEYATTFEGRVLSELKSIAQAAQSTANSARQIRNAIVFVILAGVLMFILASVFGV